MNAVQIVNTMELRWMPLGNDWMPSSASLQIAILAASVYTSLVHPKASPEGLVAELAGLRLSICFSGPAYGLAHVKYNQI